MKYTGEKKRIDNREIAKYFKVDRRTVQSFKKRYEEEKGKELDFRLAEDVISFIVWFDYNR